MNEEKLTQKLEAAGAPTPIAERKAQDSAIGWVLTLAGLVAFGVSAAALLIFAWTRTEVGASIVTLLIAFLFAGLLLASIGSHLVAREVAPGVYKSVTDAVVRVIAAWRNRTEG